MLSKLAYISAFFVVVSLQASCGEEISFNHVTLSWTAPATNEDGSELDDLYGYTVYYGKKSRYYSYKKRNAGYQTVAEVYDLDSGTWYFAVTAIDHYGKESDFSNEVFITFK